MAEVNIYNHDSWSIVCITNGTWKQNCYLLQNSTSDRCIIIDPGSEGKSIIDYIEKNNLAPMAIYNTHGHYDHIGAIEELKEKYNLTFYIHSADKKLIKHGNLYRLIFDDIKVIKIPKVDFDLERNSNQVIPKDWQFNYIHTPGHTEGSCCFIFGDIIFTGDTLLKSGTGRTDLPGGDKSKIKSSLETLKKIDKNKYVFPGHGKPFYLSEIVNSL
jgi:hydroxyacylglutathione hydrolase